jgi:hypothetical protein
MAARRRRVLLGALAASAFAGVTGALSVGSQPAERVIQIRAHKFTYEPDEIVLKLKVPVVLEFTSSDVPWAGCAPDFGVRATIVRPDLAGAHRSGQGRTFHSTVTSSRRRPRGMDGTIRVRPDRHAAGYPSAPRARLSAGFPAASSHPDEPRRTVPRVALP